jgi:transaldolase
MSIYLDSAHLEDARRAQALGFVVGITTNPALVAQAGRPGLDIVRDLLTLTGGYVFYQVIADTVEERLEEAREASRLDPARVMIKIPATTENLAMAAELVAGDVLCAITAVSAASQAYLSAMVGATFTIPYVNRLTRQLGDGLAVVRDCKAAVEGSETRVLAASLKSPEEVMSSIYAGADDVTIPLDIILQMGNHPLSDKAIQDFARHQALRA